jgi:hypothetical protein
MGSDSLVSRLSASLIALFLMSAGTYVPVHGRGPAQGDRGVIRAVRRPRRLSAGGDRRSANRRKPIRAWLSCRKIQYQDRRRCDHQIACSNIAEAKKMDRDTDILFLVLTSHGSPDGLAITAGRQLKR